MALESALLEVLDALKVADVATGSAPQPRPSSKP
jgi:hypothetical protein